MRFRAAAAARGERDLNVDTSALAQAHKLFEMVSFSHMDMAELLIDTAAEGVEIGAAHCFGAASAQFLQLCKAAELQNVRFLLRVFFVSATRIVYDTVFPPIFLEDS